MLAKEGLLKVNAKNEANDLEIKKKVKNSKSTNFLRSDPTRISEGNSASLSGENDILSLENRFGTKHKIRMRNLARMENSPTEEPLEELTGLKGAIILIVRIIIDIIGSILGYGTISPTYYNYM